MYDYILNSDDTITAISTPEGIGAISIIRISGKKSIKIINKIFYNKKKNKYNFTNIGIIKNKNNIIDQVIVIIFKKPNSYTGENLVEIFCHGSIYIQKTIIKIIINNGARLAKNGEFTCRAFLNKKITLLQAESVLDIINSENKIYHKIAINNLLYGKLSNYILKIEKKILNILSYIEISLDFTEEDIYINKKKIYNNILYIEKKIKLLVKSFSINSLIKEGFYISIIGPVNSGKSTLMNALIKEEKSIISNIPGTTRDVVEGKIVIKNFNFFLFDTAGIRKSKYIIENIGIKKTFKKIKESNIIFYVFDFLLLKNIKYFKKKIKKYYNLFLKKKVILIANKIDKKKKYIYKIKYIKINKKKIKIIFISAKNKIGLHKIKKFLKKQIPNKNIKENNLINNIRHYEELRNVFKLIKKVKKDFKQKISLELISIDLRESISCLYKLNGKSFDNNYILNNIFSKFCIGK